MSKRIGLYIVFVFSVNMYLDWSIYYSLHSSCPWALNVFLYCVVCACHPSLDNWVLRRSCFVIIDVLIMHGTVYRFATSKARCMWILLPLAWLWCSISGCTCCRILMECGVGVPFSMLSQRRHFLENQLTCSHILLIGVKNFYPYFAYFMTDLHEIRYINHPYNAVEQFYVSWKSV